MSVSLMLKQNLWMPSWKSFLIKTSLRQVLIIPFVLQMLFTVALIVYLSYSNAQRSIGDLAVHLQDEIHARVSQHLNNYLATPKNLVRMNKGLFDSAILQAGNLEQLQKYFYQQLQSHPVSYINFGTSSGQFVGVTKNDHNQTPQLEVFDRNQSTQLSVYSFTGQGEQGILQTQHLLNPLQDAWYTDAVKAGKPLWSQIYQCQNLPIISISYSTPIFDPADRLSGVMGVDLQLNDISNFLQKINTGASGRVFIMERNGLMVANSVETELLHKNNHHWQRINVMDSQDHLTRETARFLRQKFHGFQSIQQHQLRFNFQGEQIFLRVSPWQQDSELDWVVVEVLPESDFMAQIHKHTQRTIGLSILAVIISIGIGLRTLKWITQPLQDLKNAATSMSLGHLNQQVFDHDRQDEIGILTRAFNQMADQLSTAFRELQHSHETLEQRVIERTEQLEVAKVAAEVANLAKSDFLAQMSHELRTPLNGILGYCQILTEQDTLSLKDQNRVGVIQQCAIHLLGLINDILDISRMERGKFELNSESVVLSEIIQSVIDIAQIQAEEKQLQFNYRPIGPMPSLIYIDEQRLRQILINLLSNAIKFTIEGYVSLQVELVSNHGNKNCLRFQVEDSGIGMTEADLQTIFRPFEQLGTSNQKIAGSGLGLSISQKIVQEMGGKIQVQSIAGQGSRFWFEILC
jgi:signal transduction histidine kinase